MFRQQVVALVVAAAALISFTRPAAGQVVSPAQPAAVPAADGRIFELRTYRAAPGKLDALHARFRDHARQLFEKHGITNVGYWVPVGNPDDQVVFLLAYPSLAAREQAWRGLTADPEWLRAKRASERTGRLVASIDERFLTAAEFNAAAAAARTGEQHIFELRQVSVSPNNLAAELTRLRTALRSAREDGVTTVGVWTAQPTRPGGNTDLVYLVARKPADVLRESFVSLQTGVIPVGLAEAPKASRKLPESDASPALVLQPTEYSPIK